MFLLTPDFFSYQDGIYSNADCSKQGVASHSMLIIGFGTDSQGGDFWLVQNSWGTQWGQQGFAKISRG
jgi:C1A family cysteine protease